MDNNKVTPMVKPQEAADILHISKRTIYDLIQKRKIQYYKVGTLIRFRREDLDEYLENRQVKAIGK